MRPWRSGAASCPDPTDPAKYKNSPETPIYAKSKTLYGLNWAKADIAARGQAVVCEGYTDVIGFHRAGVTTAVATCGTAFTEDHVRLLKRYASRVVLAFDADAAGQGAAERFYEWEQQARDAGGGGPTARRAWIRASWPSATRPRWLPPSRRPSRSCGSGCAGCSTGRRCGTPEDRVRLAERAMAVVNEHPDRNVQRLYAGEVASQVGLPRGRPRARGPGRRQEPDAPSCGAVAAPMENAEFAAIALLAQDWESIAEWLVEELFDDESHRRAFLALAAAEGDLDGRHRGRRPRGT